MKGTKKLLSVFLTIIMIASSLSCIAGAVDEIPEGFTPIYDIEDLYMIRNKLDGNYILMNDIDMTEDIAEGGDWDNGQGWLPIGLTATSYSEFTGIFDGNNHTIKGLRINVQAVNSGYSGSYYSGIFAYNSGEIKNLNLTEGDVYVNSAYESYIGVLCGYNKNTIKNCSVSGKFESMENKSYDKSHYCGAVCGYNDNYIADCSVNIEAVVSNRPNDGSSSSYSYLHFGGITGYNSSNATVERCKTDGYIIGNAKGYYYYYSYSTYYSSHAYNYIGGIVGNNLGIISECFNKADIHSYLQKASSSYPYSISCSYQGGIAGYQNSGSTTKAIAIIENCYNMGNLSIEKETGVNSDYSYYIGGICGYINYGSVRSDIINAYNFGNVSGITGESSNRVGEIAGYRLSPKNTISGAYYISGRTPIGSGSDTCTSLSENMFKKKGCFPDFDFENVWFIDTSTGVERPQLINNPEVAPASHEHSYDTEVVTNPTCTSKGYTTYTCACGDSYVDNYTDMTSHVYGEWNIIKVATHLEEGSKKCVCTVCGNDVMEVIAKTTEHTYEAVITNPTCTAKGYTTYTCACGDSYVDNYTDMTAHTYGDWETVKEATHTEEGLKRKICSSCGNEAIEAIKKTLDHTFTEIVTEPTCKESGYTMHYCTGCGVSYIDNVTKPIDHMDKNGDNICDSCGETVEIEDLHVHDFQRVDIKKATCKTEGLITLTCSECGETKQLAIAIDKDNHNYGDWTYTSTATCVTEGELSHKCTLCGKIETQTISINITNHTGNIEVVNAISATCTAVGYSGDVYCADCHLMIEEGKETSCTDHFDNNNDGYCDTCNKQLSTPTPSNPTKKCDCKCHSKGFSLFIWKIINFFHRIFRMNKYRECPCGEKMHW